ncbi:ATP-binding cassette domain-containing protein [Enterococcus faecium]|uniref:ATP-binding cassette domain-containing protein n=1 Tax=Enterococcus faecium TaxID=1352 RepID=UPI000F4D973C|nr:ABC transporter ATP-binding protein [Enterococcus faecium]EKO5893025.1 ABC transporter ATP-binding protein [Enterococcus faecium]ROX78080.1 ABC transporter ATP-binding protein [Enterococcus faecium]
MTLLIKNMNMKRGKKRVIRQLDLLVESGEVAALIAPNGFGKTTLLNGIAQLLPTTYDQLSLHNISPTAYTDYRRSFFFLESTNQLSDYLTAVDYLTLIKYYWQSKVECQTVFQRLKMTEYLTLPIGKMSLGMKQHVLLAVYLISDSSVMLFDEPLNGLDPGSIDILNRLIRQWQEEGKTILLSSHAIANIQSICSKACFLKNGEIVTESSNMEEILAIYRQLYEV